MQPVVMTYVNLLMQVGFNPREGLIIHQVRGPAGALRDADVLQNTTYLQGTDCQLRAGRQAVCFQ
jgi:hypothetical protein